MGKTNYKATLNLPRTSFPMKADLPKREPEILERWERMDLYGKIRQKARGRPKYILHDGPPYANGHIHLGTALNKVLKDLVVKVKNMEDYDAPFVPGWDCHGLPIEHQVDRELGERKDAVSPPEKRRLCRAYAERYVGVQREEFKRLGVLGDWERPYLTMSYDYEASIVREIGKFMEQGSVYRGLKPVHWCAECRTALAEAEVEYQEHASPSIYVRFPLTAEQARALGERVPSLQGKLSGKRVSVLIWTTTPWTLPANLALAFHPKFFYNAVARGDEVVILGEGFRFEVFHRAYPELLERRNGRLVFRADAIEILAVFPGEEVEGLSARHPFLDRDSRFVLADYVTADQGTGVVHTAPGHGREDYETGMKYGLEIYNPVDDQGRFVAELPHFGGQSVFEANPAIVSLLRERGLLWAQEELTHTYPHCWRCHNPTLFRATAQWFISMEAGELRQRALAEVEKVEWIPAWGRERIASMLATRPDWCISRQRAWGVPIPALRCKKCEEYLFAETLAERVAERVEREGADVWFAAPTEEFLPPGTRCPKCGGSDFEKEENILDVWFDSGVSQAAVLPRHPDLTWPCDMYLEGSDQHRGWFHSSLLAALGSRDTAPYRIVLTHGYVVDGEGRKMSKSLGNILAPEEVISQYGAEVLRLWVASENYRDDIRISPEILKRLAEAYRRIRNTCRFILGNLGDFDPRGDSVPYGQRPDVDRYVLHRLQHLIGRIRRAYDAHEFHVFYHSFHNFCAVDLSAWYLDWIKDRLYVSGKDNPKRRAAQSTLYELLHTMVRLMAPVLSFTAEEVWDYLPRAKDEVESVHLTLLPESKDSLVDEKLAREWDDHLLRARDIALKAMEIKRQAGEIGHPLTATVTIYVQPNLREMGEVLQGHVTDLDMMLGTSGTFVELEAQPPPDGYSDDEFDPGFVVHVRHPSGSKCERCWRVDASVGDDRDHPTICSRCIAILKGSGGQGSDPP